MPSAQDVRSPTPTRLVSKAKRVADPPQADGAKRVADPPQADGAKRVADPPPQAGGAKWVADPPQAGGAKWQEPSERTKLCSTADVEKT